MDGDDGIRVVGPHAGQGVVEQDLRGLLHDAPGFLHVELPRRDELDVSESVCHVEEVDAVGGGFVALHPEVLQ